MVGNDEDAASAFSWIKKNVEILHAAPRKLFIVGHSSGALIAALLSTDEKYLKKSGCSLSDIAGCVAMGKPCSSILQFSPFSFHVLDC